jgi:aminoglycoside 6'-N-acetyltransferase I
VSELRINVRFAQPADAPRWVALRQDLWPDAKPREHAAEVSAFFAGTLVEPEIVLVAEGLDGAVLGFVELSRRASAEGCRTSPVAYVEGWYVDPAVRRRGVGRALLGAAEQWARQQGCLEIASDTEVENTASAAAHHALGFDESAVIRCFRKVLHPVAAT